MTDTSARPIQLLVVDDHSLFRRGLMALLAQDPRFEVTCEAGDVGEALRCAARRRPDVILLDNHLPGVLGVDAIPALREAAPGSRVLMLTVSENEADLVAALKAGADGYLLKTVESHHLCEAIVKVMDGESVVSPEMTTKLVSALRAQPPAQGVAPDTPVSTATATSDAELASLSARELEILHLIARGDSNKHIARQLDIAETTVKIHVQHILRKLHLTSRVQAAVFAARHA
ncbi:response regulator [Hydrogenophaga sp.]|uniref:response regulator n=1 Tax=Hydrogenophaga sp. TaxID=1904254 RepID=UPI002737147E|nr:response regulator [Hydrogenophaga sp.]MDP2985972.1 response regulator [Hydrogenophaga sp.]MDP3350016.1 response regulator [Hydrogenophaga sp.]MDZ4281660.1 response regulator [Hydrogenophaga sp.]MDZ4396505.1 response regulator [Hydrogenophaga sp.]